MLVWITLLEQIVKVSVEAMGKADGGGSLPSGMSGIGEKLAFFRILFVL